MISRNTWDNVVIVIRDGETDQTWDGKVKNLIYDVDSMAWIAQEATAGGGGGGGDASAANQVTEIAKLTSIDAKLPDFISSAPASDTGQDAVPVRLISQVSGIGEFAVQKDEASETVTYFGYANPGTADASASWRIKKLTLTGSDFKVEYADGNSNFDNVWNNRVSLSYS